MTSRQSSGVASCSRTSRGSSDGSSFCSRCACRSSESVMICSIGSGAAIRAGGCRAGGLARPRSNISQVQDGQWRRRRTASAGSGTCAANTARDRDRAEIEIAPRSATPSCVYQRAIGTPRAGGHIPPRRATSRAQEYRGPKAPCMRPSAGAHGARTVPGGATSRRAMRTWNFGAGYGNMRAVPAAYVTSGK